MLTEKNKELLLKEICARIPYGVKLLHETWNYEWDDEMSLVERVVGIDEEFIYTKVIDTHTGEEYTDDKIPIYTFDDKLYLRSLSSMTDDEVNQYKHLVAHSGSSNGAANFVDWLYKNHFNINLPEHLFIAVTKENNPYG